MTAPDELPDELADRAAEQLLGADAGARDALLQQWIAAHPGHAAGLRRLWAELGGAERMLADAWPGPGGEMPAQIGGHRVLRRLGEGSFGIVFLCAQERPVVRQVAVKVLRPGAGDDRTLRRFAAERQLLASLNHPSITQVFDAGALPDGRPFFVMEHVEGATFRRYCDDRSLPCRDRLRLFADLCRGVAHAHARGIVHRDLKPSNVLVVETEQGPVPKIIDFGIAKALFAPAHGSDGLRTDTGRVIGTPGYMSPEQAAGSTDGIDERADVFALGVMLYELLTGALPWERGAAATDTDPVRPSARVTTASTSTAPRNAHTNANANAPAAASHRRQLAAELRGDLDWITLKALARDRGERYTSANALAADVERHLRGEPVSAGPPSTIYRLRKFVRRNRAAVVAVAAMALLSVVGLVAALAHGSVAEAQVADVQRVAAEQVADAQRAASESHAEAIAAVNRLLVRANDAALRDAPKSDAVRQALLQDALACYDRLSREHPADADVRAGRCKALEGLANVHWLLGEPARVAELAELAFAEATELQAAAPDDLGCRGLVGEALRWRGAAACQAGSNTAAHPSFAAAAERLAPCAAADPVTHARAYAAALRETALTLAPERADERLDGLQRSMAVLQSLREHEPRVEYVANDLVNTGCSLAGQLFAMRRLVDAEAVLARAEQELPDLDGDRQLARCRLYRMQGKIAWELRRDQALELVARSVTAATEWQREQPDRLLPNNNLALSLRDQAYMLNYAGHVEESAATYHRLIDQLEQMRQRFADEPSHALVLIDVLQEFAVTLLDGFRQRSLDEAARCLDRALAIDDALPPEVDAGRKARFLLLSFRAQIEESRRGGDPDPIWAEVERSLPADPVLDHARIIDDTAGTYAYLGRWHLARGRLDAAAAWIGRARELADRLPDVLFKRMVDIGWQEARLAALRGDHAEAAAAGERVLKARPTWYGCRRAADCLHRAWRCALAQEDDPTAAAAAVGYRDRAAELYAQVLAELREDVAKDPTDPWYVLPWGFAGVRAAELAAAAGDEGAARDLLAAALPRLDAVAPESQRDQWDDEAMRDGRALQAKLAATAVDAARR